MSWAINEKEYIVSFQDEKRVIEDSKAVQSIENGFTAADYIKIILNPILRDPKIKIKTYRMKSPFLSSIDIMEAIYGVSSTLGSRKIFSIEAVKVFFLSYFYQIKKYNFY